MAAKGPGTIVLNLQRNGKLSKEFDDEEWIALAEDIWKEAKQLPAVHNSGRDSLPTASLEIASLLLGRTELIRTTYESTLCVSRKIYEDVLKVLWKHMIESASFPKLTLDTVARTMGVVPLRSFAAQLVQAYEKANDITHGEQPAAYIAAFALILSKRLDQIPYPVQPQLFNQVLKAMKPHFAPMEKTSEFRKAQKEMSRQDKAEPDTFDLVIEYANATTSSTPTNETDSSTTAPTASIAKGPEHRVPLLPTVPFWESPQFATVLKRLRA